MAQEFKIEINYIDLTKAEVIIHNNNDVQVITLPPLITLASATKRIGLWEFLTNYSRVNNIKSIELTKL